MAPGIRSGLGITTEIQSALIRLDTPEIYKTEFANLGFLKQFGNLRQQPFSAGGLRVRYETAARTDPYALGADVSRATAIPRPHQTLQYDDIVYTTHQFNNLAVSIVLDNAVEQYVRGQGMTQGAFDDAAIKLNMMATQDLNHMLSINQICDRRAILGSVVKQDGVTQAATTAATESTTDCGQWDGMWYATFELGSDAIVPALRKGMQVSICDAPSNYAGSSDAGAATGVVRNYGNSDDDSPDAALLDHIPLHVLEDASPNSKSSALGYGTVKLGMYYHGETGRTTAETRFNTIVTGAVGTADVITPYAGMLSASTITLALRGPNFGSQGLLHWMQPFNIETALGACSTALYTSAGTAVSRFAAGNFEWQVPYSVDHNNASAVSMAAIESVFRTVGYRHGGTAKGLFVIMNPTVWTALAATLGVSAYRINEASGDSLKARYAKYGVQTLTFQGVGTEPIVLGMSDWIPPNMVMFLDPTDYEQLIPSEAKWQENGGGGIWFPLRNSSGEIQAGFQAYKMLPWQMAAYRMNRQAVIKHTTA
ncbi:MAG: hypothetical protein IMZ57_04065 [Acidobacteria bacterium]|nr:hypothetical protein [Acidobacteriota bacterium]